MGYSIEWSMGEFLLSASLELAVSFMQVKRYADVLKLLLQSLQLG